MLQQTQIPAKVRVTVVLDAVTAAVLPFDEAERVKVGWLALVIT